MHSNLKKRFLDAREEIIKMDFGGLNDMQLKAVMATEGPLLVLAGAGSGKTTVLIQRIANLIKYGRASDTDDIPPDISEKDVEYLESYIKSPDETKRRAAEALCAVDPVAPWSIIAITFTNKAADELKSRLVDRLGNGALDVWASTFHSACVRILRRDIERLGYSRSFTIYDTDDSQRVMKSVLSDLNILDNTFTPKSVLKFVSIAKDKMVPPNDYEKTFTDSSSFHASRIAKAYAEYQRRLKNANALDFDDIILLTVTLLNRYDDVREYYQHKFKYVLIDEYQDTNNLQYMLANTLAGYWKNICVVGDDDQSIYRFRGATVENILSFDKKHKSCRVIKLEQNYRSTGNILKAANGVIENNNGRKGKNLWTSNSEGERICVYMSESEADEAHFIAKSILEGYQSGDKFGNYAILYRMNALSNRIEDAFKRNAIPYRIIGGTRFYDRAEIKDMLAYLHVIRNPDDDLRLIRIINNPPRKIGTRTIEIIEDIAQSTGQSMFDIVEKAFSYEQLLRQSDRLITFAEMIRNFQKLADVLPLSELYDAVLEQSGYLSHLEEKTLTDQSANTRIENILELKSSTITYSEQSDEPTLAGFLDEVSLFTDIDNYDNDADSVTLMTIHSAKGLEFPTVFLIGMEEGIFPSFQNIGYQEEMEEERRLCYVGITRARKKLYITHARSRMLFGRTSYNRVSRFVEEIPSSCSEYMEDSSVQSSRNAYRPQFNDFSVGQTSSRKSQRAAVSTRFSPTSASNTQMISLKSGDNITHKAFGEGKVVNVTPMGGDALVEVDFSEGKKRLMLKTASKFITKL